MSGDKWARLKPEDAKTLGLSSYHGEVILIDYGRNPVDGDSFYFNAQEFFSDDQLQKMPLFDVWLFIDNSRFTRGSNNG